METILKDGFAALGLPCTAEVAKQFVQYKDLLVEWNEKMNLTAITEESEIAVKHFIDSVVVHDTEVIPKDAKIIDVGTGAGFPGLPLKLVRPDLHVTLLDSLQKRLNFLDAVIHTLGLSDIKTVHVRAEDGARDPKLREKFDVAVSRAVANMATLSEYCLPYVRQGGMFLAYKSGTVETELAEAKKAISELGGEVIDVKFLTLPDTDLSRSIVMVKKVRGTPNKYPRQAGKPAKNPIK